MDGEVTGMAGRVFTVAEAAAAWGVNPVTVRRHLRAGAFPGARRATPDQSSAWLIPLGDLTAVWGAPGPTAEKRDGGTTAPVDPASAWQSLVVAQAAHLDRLARLLETAVTALSHHTTEPTTEDDQ